MNIKKNKQGNFAFTKMIQKIMSSSLDYELYLSNNPNEQDNLNQL
jgi:hypothetical protein